MPNKDYQEMTEFFKERGLTVPSLFERFAESVVQEPGMSRWRVGESPAAWPFPSPGESGDSAPDTSGPFTNFVSVGFTLYEPWDEIDDEYGDAVIDLRLVTRGLLMEFRTSEGHNVLKGGGNSWNWNEDSEWIPFWNEATSDLNAFATKVDLFAQFENLTEVFTPENNFCFDSTRNSISNVIFHDGAQRVIDSTYLDGPPGLGDLLWDNYGDASDRDDIDED
jgi:hypothetical protein